MITAVKAFVKTMLITSSSAQLVFFLPTQELNLLIGVFLLDCLNNISICIMLPLLMKS